MHGWMDAWMDGRMDGHMDELNHRGRSMQCQPLRLAIAGNFCLGNDNPDPARPSGRLREKGNTVANRTEAHKVRPRDMRSQHLQVNSPPGVHSRDQKRFQRISGEQPHEAPHALIKEQDRLSYCLQTPTASQHPRQSRVLLGPHHNRAPHTGPLPGNRLRGLQVKQSLVVANPVYCDIMVSS